MSKPKKMLYLKRGKPIFALLPGAVLACVQVVNKARNSPTTSVYVI